MLLPYARHKKVIWISSILNWALLRVFASSTTVVRPSFTIPNLRSFLAHSFFRLSDIWEKGKRSKTRTPALGRALLSANPLHTYCWTSSRCFGQADRKVPIYYDIQLYDSLGTARCGSGRRDDAADHDLGPIPPSTYNGRAQTHLLKLLLLVRIFFFIKLRLSARNNKPSCPCPTRSSLRHVYTGDSRLEATPSLCGSFWKTPTKQDVGSYRRLIRPR